MRFTPLQEAAIGHNKERVKKLIAAGADIDELDPKGRATALGFLAETGDVEMMRFLLELGADPNEACPLFQAAQVNQVEAASVLLEAGANPNRYWLDSVPSPVAAAVMCGRTEMLVLLAEHGAKLPQLSGYRNLVRTAVWYGHPGVLEELLLRGHACDQRDEQGSTPLCLAAFQGYLECAKVLIRHGAPLDVPDNRGKTPLQIARERGHDDVAAFLEAHAKGAMMPTTGPVPSRPAGRDREDASDW